MDENVQVAVAEQLRAHGVEVFTVRDLGTLGDSDLNHLMRAISMNCVLCTYDQDYLVIASQGIPHTGIVFAWQDRTTIGD